MAGLVPGTKVKMLAGQTSAPTKQKRQVWAILAHTNATKAVFELQADPNRDPARGQASENPQPKTSPFKAKCLEPKWLRNVVARLA